MKRLTLSILTNDESLFSRLQRLSDDYTLYRLANCNAIDGLPENSLILLDTASRHLSDNTPEWLARCQRYRILIASSQPSSEEGIEWLERGVAGYFHAYASEETLLQAINVVAGGEVWVGRELMGRLLKGLGTHRTSKTLAWQNSLTEREHEVALRAANAETNMAIAEALGITERTVKAHLTAIFDKLGVTDRLQLALKVHGIR